MPVSKLQFPTQIDTIFIILSFPTSLAPYLVYTAILSDKYILTFAIKKTK
jgi:hypothetical protein